MQGTIQISASCANSKDYGQALKWFQEGAERGFGRAEYCMGAYYLRRRFILLQIVREHLYSEGLSLPVVTNVPFRIECSFRSFAAVTSPMFPPFS